MRTETREYDIYKYDELNDSAKDRARDWWREGGLDYDWWDTIYEDAQRLGEIFGITDMDISFTGFWCQGDGANFTGDYRFKRDMLESIKGYAPLDETLHGIAEELEAAQGCLKLPLTAAIRSNDNRYCHEYCVNVNVDIEQDAHYTDDDYIEITDENEAAVTEALRKFMRWIYKTLESEYNYLNSDEAVVESIECNEYEFLSDGSRATMKGIEQ